MPCYDKKLEASRQDFYNEVYGTRDVDCVITTGELDLMMREKGWNLSMVVPGESNPQSLYWNFENQNVGMGGKGRNGEVKDGDKDGEKQSDQNHEGWDEDDDDDDDEEGRDSDSRMITANTTTTERKNPKIKKTQTPKPSLPPLDHSSPSSSSSDSSLPGVVSSKKEFVNGDGRIDGKGRKKGEVPADGGHDDDDDDDINNNDDDGDGDNLSFTFNSFEFPELVPHPGSSSGSYLHSLISILGSESLHPNSSTGSSVTEGGGVEERMEERGRRREYQGSSPFHPIKSHPTQINPLNRTRKERIRRTSRD